MPDADPLAATLAGIREIEQAATPGPWEAGGIGGDDIWSDAKGGFVAETFNNPADAEFIAAARTYVPLLLASLEAVLNLAVEWDREAVKLTARSDFMFERGDEVAPVMLDGRAQAHKECADMIRETITRELTGTPEEGSDDGT